MTGEVELLISSESGTQRLSCQKCVKCFSPSRVQKQHSVLMSVIAGEAVAAVRSLEDKQVLQQCMASLRELFKEQVRHACH